MKAYNPCMPYVITLLAELVVCSQMVSKKSIKPGKYKELSKICPIIREIKLCVVKAMKDCPEISNSERNYFH